MTIGQRIAVKRKALGISQIALGERLGVSRQSISKWESDAAIPEIDKLIALSRLFSVSVGWLLGVEEAPAPEPEAPEAPEVQPEEDPAGFPQREKEILEALSRSRPAAPAWQKYAVIGAAVLSALSLALSAVSLYRSAKLPDQLQQELLTASQVFSQLAATDENGVPLLLEQTQLEDYSFTITPWAGLDGADFSLSATPMYHEDGSKAQLVILLNGQEYLRTECQWDAGRFTADFSLPAADGYTASLLLTSANGITITNPLADQVVTKLGSSMDFGDPSVTYEKRTCTGGTLTLTGVRVQIPMPQAYRDTPDLWSKCDLVVTVDGAEADRVDLLNRSAYSKTGNFSGPEVDFFTQSQSFDLGALSNGSEVVLTLECRLSTGLDLIHTVAAWTVRAGTI